MQEVPRGLRRLSDHREAAYSRLSPRPAQVVCSEVLWSLLDPCQERPPVSAKPDRYLFGRPRRRRRRQHSIVRPPRLWEEHSEREPLCWPLYLHLSVSTLADQGIADQSFGHNLGLLTPSGTVT